MSALLFSQQAIYLWKGNKKGRRLLRSLMDVPPDRVEIEGSSL